MVPGTTFRGICKTRGFCVTIPPSLCLHTRNSGRPCALERRGLLRAGRMLICSKPVVPGSIHLSCCVEALRSACILRVELSFNRSDSTRFLYADVEVRINRCFTCLTIPRAGPNKVTTNGLIKGEQSGEFVPVLALDCR